MRRFDVSEVTEFSPEKYEKVSLFDAEGGFSDFYCFEPGQEQEPHVHDDSDKLYYVVEGEGEFTVGDEVLSLGEGEGVVAEAGERHGVRNTSESRLTALVFMAWGEKRGDGGDEDSHGHSHSHDHDHDHASEKESLDFAVLTVSSTRDENDDPSGDTVRRLVTDEGHTVTEYGVVSDDLVEIRHRVKDLTGEVDAVVTTGGTGITPDDVTVEAVDPLIDKKLPGFGELFRRLSTEEIGTSSIMSRAFAGVSDDTPVFVLPGSQNGVHLAVEEILLEEIDHVVGLAGR